MLVALSKRWKRAACAAALAGCLAAGSAHADVIVRARPLHPAPRPVVIAPPVVMRGPAIVDVGAPIAFAEPVYERGRFGWGERGGRFWHRGGRFNRWHREPWHR